MNDSGTSKNGRARIPVSTRTNPNGMNASSRLLRDTALGATSAGIISGTPEGGRWYYGTHLFAAVPRNPRPLPSIRVMHSVRLMSACLWGGALLLAVVTAACARPDDVLVADVRAHLTADAALRGASISVTAKKGVVLLRGD